MTDLNALIERAVKEAAWLFCSQLRGAGVQDAYQLADVFETSLRQAPSLEALRTLAERQPEKKRVAEMTVTELMAESARVEKLWTDMRSSDEELGGGSPGEWMVERMDEIDTLLRRNGLCETKAAEQRGADRAFEEAAGIARSYEEALTPSKGLPDEYKDGFLTGVADASAAIEDAIRQRIGAS